jgi:hypothetical protein
VTASQSQERRGRDSNPRPVPYVADCVLWTGARQSKGYGLRVVKGRRSLAHRVAYERVYGRLDPHVQLHHVCCNKLCVNPEHLQPITSLKHKRQHMASIGAPEFVERMFARHQRLSRRSLVAAAAGLGITEKSIAGALNRLPVRKVGWGIYESKDTP